MTLDLTNEEATVLRNLLHVAVQAKGMEVAEAAVVLDHKIVAAAKAAQEAQAQEARVAGLNGEANG